MRWRSILVAGATTLGAVACTSAPEEEVGTLRTFVAGDAFEVPRSRSGRCSFDNRSQVHRIDPVAGLVWSRDVPWVPPDIGLSSLLVVHDDVIVGKSRPVAGDRRSFVFALDVDTGSPRWQRTVAGSLSALHRPLAWGDLVVVGEGADLVALDLATGGERWRRPAAVGGSPALVDLGLVHGLDDGSLVVVDPATGVQVGELPIVAPNGWFQVYEVEGGLLLAIRGSLLLIDPATSTVRWEHDLGTPSSASSEVSVLGDVVLVSEVHHVPGEGGSAYLVALDLATGEERWGRGRGPTLLPADHMRTLVAAETGREELSMISPTTGEVRWVVDGTDHLGGGRPRWGRVVSQPGDDLVLVGLPYLREEPPDDLGWTTTTEGALLVAFDADDGTVLWQLDRPGWTPAASVVVDGVLLVGSGGGTDWTVVDDDPAGRLLALDPEDGSVRWEVELRDAVTSVPMVAGGQVVVLSSDPWIFCD